MSFLAPLFLVGGLAVAAPILFHLIRRTTRERTPFSSMMFLTPSPPRITRRSRLEHVLLLLLRCLVLALLAAGFARPFLPASEEDPAGRGVGRRTLVLIDASASMRRAGVWEAVTRHLETTLGELRPDDALALYQFDRELRPLVTFARWNELPAGTREAVLRDEFMKLRPGWGPTRLGAVLARAAGLLEEMDDEGSRSAASRVVLISDLQEGADLTGLQAFEWPQTYELKLLRADPGNRANAGIQHLPPKVGGSAERDQETVKVRVFNSADAPTDRLRVKWADTSGKVLGAPVEAYVPAGQSRVISLTRPETDTAVRVMLDGDAEDFDNTAWVAPTGVRTVEVSYFGPEAEDAIREPLFFLRGALPETRDFRFRINRRVPDAPLPARGLVVWTGAVAASEQRPVRAFVEAGGVVLCAPRDEAGMASAFELLGAAPVGIEEVTPPRYALLGEVDFRHPLFTPFADPRFSDFSKIHFWKYRRFPAESLSNARVPARFDNGDPAVVQAPLGQGFVLLLAGGWHPADSQLALSTKFVPLLHSLLDLAGLLDRVAAQHRVGDEVPLPFAPAVVVSPDGSRREEVESRFAETREPGLYQVTGGTNTLQFAVNLDPRESRTDALAPEELERFGVRLQEKPSAVEEEKSAAQLKNSELEQRQKLWRWLIAAALVILSIEMLMAGRLARRPATEAAP